MGVATVPFVDDMEKALIVGLLSDPSIIPRVAAELEVDDFYKEYHKEIYRIIKEIGNDSTDSLTVQERLSGEAKEYFLELVKSSDSLLPSLTNIIIYAQTIRDKAKLRAGINLGREIQALCFEPNIPASEALEKLEGMFSVFLQGRVIENKIQNTKDAFAEFLEDLKYRKEEVGIQTGFSSIDSLIGKLEGLIILAARPSTGKSQLGFQIARNIAETRPVLIFSLEQNRNQVFERLIAAEAEIRLDEIRRGDIQENPAFVTAATNLNKVFENIHIDDTANTTSQYISSIARQKKFEWGDLGFIVVDYLHIMQLEDGNKVDTLGQAAKELRALGKELNTPILLLSQLSRQPEMVQNAGEKRHRRPELTDLRGSGEIEQVSDIVIFLYKESVYDSFTSPAEDIVEVIVRKNRNGAIGVATLNWTARFVRFSDL